MIIGTHNTMTYLPTKKWWMRPLAIFAKCQDKSLEQQIALGARYFDIRVRFDKNGNPILAHGLVEYEGNVWDALKTIAQCVEVPYVRIMLETMKDANPYQRKFFYTFKKHVMEFYPTLRFRFMYKNPFKVVESHWSGVSFSEVSRWIHKWWELLLTPRFFAKEQCDKIVKLYDSKFNGIIAMDFYARVIKINK